VNLQTEQITLQAGDSVLYYNRKTEKLVRRLATRSKLCEKLDRLRRSSKKSSLRKLRKLQERIEKTRN